MNPLQVYFYLGFSLPSSMKAPLALAVGKPTRRGLSSFTGVRELVCNVANIESTSSFDSSESLFIVSTTRWPSKIDTTFDIGGRFIGEYCTQANPNFMTCFMSSSLDLSTSFGSMKSCSLSASYSFHACKIINTPSEKIHVSEIPSFRRLVGKSFNNSPILGCIVALLGVLS
jgi:hypothetical protein